MLSSAYLPDINLALDGCELSDCLHWPLYCQRNSSGFHWGRGWVGAGAVVDVLEKR